MKRKALVALFCVMALAALTVNAGAVVYNCTISQSGATNSGFYYVTVTDTASPAAFTNRSFLIDGANVNAKPMFAAALTALAGTGTVQLDLPTTSQWTFVNYVTALK